MKDKLSNEEAADIFFKKIESVVDKAEDSLYKCIKESCENFSFIQRHKVMGVLLQLLNEKFYLTMERDIALKVLEEFYNGAKDIISNNDRGKN